MQFGCGNQPLKCVCSLSLNLGNRIDKRDDPRVSIAKTLDLYKQGSNRVRRTIIRLRQEELAVSQGTCCETPMMIAVAYCDGAYGYCKG